ncbi:MAG TPA: PocR ligand-binding domain-containing protein [Clostridiaceae bacterium]
MFGLSIDRESLEKLIKDFNTLTGIRIAFFSIVGKQTVAYQKDMALFCSILRNDPEEDDRCKRCDIEACIRAKEKRGLYLYQCHAGLTEAISPIIINSEILGYMMFGQVLNSPPTEELWRTVLSKCRVYKTDLVALKKAFFLLSGMEEEKLQAAANIMEMSSRYIYMSRIVNVKHFSIIEKIINYIDEDLEKGITISQLSAEFSMSKSYLSRLLKIEFKIPLSEYILKARVEKAKVLLMDSDLSAKTICLSLGFTDPNYFSRAFKKLVGVSPMEYRKR